MHMFCLSLFLFSVTFLSDFSISIFSISIFSANFVTITLSSWISYITTNFLSAAFKQYVVSFTEFIESGTIYDIYINTRVIRKTAIQVIKFVLVYIK